MAKAKSKALVPAGKPAKRVTHKPLPCAKSPRSNIGQNSDLPGRLTGVNYD